jgi:hypothetical protein
MLRSAQHDRCAERFVSRGVRHRSTRPVTKKKRSDKTSRRTRDTSWIISGMARQKAAESERHRLCATLFADLEQPVSALVAAVLVLGRSLVAWPALKQDPHVEGVGRHLPELSDRCSELLVELLSDDYAAHAVVLAPS